MFFHNFDMKLEKMEGVHVHTIYTDSLFPSSKLGPGITTYIVQGFPG